MKFYASLLHPGDFRHYLDLIVAKLNKNRNARWTYVIDTKDQAQRLGFLYDSTRWRLLRTETIAPGNAFGGRMRKPFRGTFQSLERPELQLDVIAIHLKAFPDAADKRQQQFAQLAAWLTRHPSAPATIICGDTNIYANEPDPSGPLARLGYQEGWSSEKTAIYQARLDQRFDRFYLSPGLRWRHPVVDSKQESAHGDYAAYSQTLSDHVPVTLTVEF
jgi:hypothetical protein